MARFFALFRWAVMLLGLFGGGTSSAQSTAREGARIEILNADRWEYDDKLAKGAQRLLGNVRFKHQDAVMQCDSAYLFEDEHVEAYGRVRIQQGDTLTITGERLTYTGHDRRAVITGDVHLRDPGMELTTDALTYDLRANTAVYTTGARIVGTRDGNTLTSRNGSYIAGAHRFIFSGDVVLDHPERRIEADTLHYTTTTGIADFLGPTRITQGEARMWCERGSYDTRTERGRFTRAARIVSEGQELRGDSLHYDRRSGEGLAWGHVAVIDTANDLLVRGDHGRYLQHDRRSTVTGRAELVMRMGEDSLHLHADTLFAFQDSSAGRRIVARRGVRFFKDDLQGVCDTMTYVERDSLISLIASPFLWSGKDQISGRLIRITLRDGRAHRLFVDGDAFLSAQADSVHFDQVTGTTLTGFFHADALKQLIADGNCRTAYFAREKKEEVERLVGLNRADCSRIVVALDSGEVEAITFITQPDATLYPLAKAPPDELRLKGFVWNAADRPRDRASIFERPVAE